MCLLNKSLPEIQIFHKSFSIRHIFKKLRTVLLTLLHLNLSDSLPPTSASLGQQQQGRSPKWVNVLLNHVLFSLSSNSSVCSNRSKQPGNMWMNLSVTSQSERERGGGWRRSAWAAGAHKKMRTKDAQISAFLRFIRYVSFSCDSSAQCIFTCFPPKLHWTCSKWRWRLNDASDPTRDSFL